MHSDALSAAIARQSMLRVRLTDAATERHAFALVDPTGSLEELKSAAIDKLKMQVGSDVNLSVTDAELTSIDELRDGDHVLCKRSNRGVSFKGRATIERTLELRTFEVHSVYDLDAEKQTCQLVFYVVFAFANGAGDPDLSEPLNEPSFPMGDDGKPTFRPNAAWFMTKIDFNNALKYKVIDRDVVKCGLDIELRMRFTGTFQQRFEVDDFPFDDQHITVSLGLNCRRNGPMPCDFALIDKTTLTIDPAGFGLRMQWKLDRNVFVHTDASAPTARPVQYLDTRVFNSQRQTSVDPSTRASAMTEGGPSGSFKKDKKAGSTTKLTKAAAAASSTGPRQFPAINFTVHVRRIPLYILAMVAFPASVMSFLSLLIYALPLQDAGDRIEASLTLVLTSFASKLSIKTLLPEASYSTLLDRFTFTCEIIVLASAVECGVLSCLALRVPDPYSQPDEVAPLTMSVEVTFFIVQASAIVLVHVYFIARFVCTVRRNRRDFDEFSSRKLNRDAEEISEKELESKKIVPLSVRRTERSPSGKNLASFVRPRAVVEGSGTALDGLNHEFREESYLDAVGPAMLKRNSSLGKSIKRVSRTLAGAQQTKRPVGWTSAGQTLRMRTSLSDQEKELTGKKEMSPRLKRESHESMTALAERASKHIQASSQLSVAQEPASGGDVKQPGPASSAATKSSHTAPTVLSRIPSYRSSPATAASAGGENDLWL